MNANIEIAAKLDEARALIEKGWCQGEFVQGMEWFLRRAIGAPSLEGCSFCAIGAVAVANKWHHEDRRAPKDIRYLAAAAGLRDRNWMALSEWNDSRGRTQAEVVEAFRKAAALARGEPA